MMWIYCFISFIIFLILLIIYLFRHKRKKKISKPLPLDNQDLFHILTSFLC